NTSHALMLGRARTLCVVPALESVATRLRELAHRHADQPLLSRTHGQPATPSTMGKEFANVVARLDRALDAIRAVQPLAKMNGATGNYNAHLAAYPEVDWPAFSGRSEEHTSELQSRENLVCRLLPEKKNTR